MSQRIYDDIRWRGVREEVLSRDGNCVLSWLGPCSGPLQVHHRSYDNPFDEGELVTVCRKHHGAADQLRRFTTKWRTCPHKPGTHRYPGAKEACERHLNRELIAV
jgi:hypothetical protein